MLVKPSAEGGLGNPADQQINRFFSPGGDFLNTRFGSRPVKRPRLSTDSLVTNGFRARSGTRMKPMQNGANTTPETQQGMMHSTQDDDTTSTSGDEGLFVIQVRSPTSKQILHSGKHSHVCNGQTRENGNITRSASDELCSLGLSEKVVGHGFVPSEMKEASAVELSDAGRDGEEAAMNSSEVVNVYVRKRKRSTAADTATVDSVALQEHGFSQAEEVERVIKHYVRRRQHRQTESHVTENPSQHVKVKEDEQHADISVQVEQGNLNVFQRRSKMNPISHAQNLDILTPKVDESEGKLNVFRRRSKVNTSPDAAPESNVNVFQRRSKMINPVSRAENLDRAEKLHVFHRRSMENQVPEAEDSLARVDNLNVFQRRSKMSQSPQVEHHDVEGEGNFNVFRRRLKVPEPENVGETGGKFHVFHRRSKMNPEKKEGGGNDELEKGVSEKLGYVRADHQPGWLPEGWTLEVREGKTAVKPRDKYYHHYQSGRIFRSKHEVLHFLADGRVGARSLTSDGSDMNQKTSPVAVTGVTNSSGDGTQLLPTDESPAKSPSDQENRGKLIFRLKRKQPDSEGGKGRSKRPMYEVIHGEKASSSTSTPSKLPTPSHLPSPHSVHRILSPSLPVKTPHIPQQNSTSEHNLLPQEQEPYTALGIPATFYSANHTHVFLENSTPASWHFPATFNSPGVNLNATDPVLEEAPQAHKALKALKASRAITKLDHTKLFLDLGRRLCLAGVEQRTRR